MYFLPFGQKWNFDEWNLVQLSHSKFLHYCPHTTFSVNFLRMVLPIVRDLRRSLWSWSNFCKRRRSTCSLLNTGLGYLDSWHQKNDIPQLALQQQYLHLCSISLCNRNAMLPDSQTRRYEGKKLKQKSWKRGKETDKWICERGRLTLIIFFKFLCAFNESLILRHKFSYVCFSNRFFPFWNFDFSSPWFEKIVLNWKWAQWSLFRNDWDWWFLLLHIRPSFHF